MVEKIEVWEVGLMICLDQGLRRSVCMCNLNCVEKKMNNVDNFVSSINSEEIRVNNEENRKVNDELELEKMGETVDDSIVSCDDVDDTVRNGVSDRIGETISETRVGCNECLDEGVKISNDDVLRNDVSHKMSPPEMDKNEIDVSEDNDGSSVKDVESLNVENRVNNTGSRNRNDVVVFDEKLVDIGSKKWELTLCHHLVGHTMSLPALNYHLRRMWSRTEYARVLLEIEASKGFKEEVELQYKDTNQNIKGTKVVKVAYDWKPSMCSHCVVFGYDYKDCKKRVRTKEEITKDKEESVKNMSSNKENGYVQNKLRRPFVWNNWSKKTGDGDGMNKGKEKISSFKEDFPKLATQNVQETQKINSEKMNINANSFYVLGDLEDDNIQGINIKEKNDILNNMEVIIEDVLEDESIAAKVMVAGELNRASYSMITVGWNTNTGMERRSLWKDLQMAKNITNGSPWVIMGDFNVTLNLDEHSIGKSTISSDMKDFIDCVNIIEVEDVCWTGLHFTWIKSPSNPNTSILNKLDTVMANEDFFSNFNHAYVVFHPFMVSDHSPIVLIMPNEIVKNKRPFKFANYVANKSDFLPTIENVWNEEIHGHHMESLKITQLDVNLFPHDDKKKKLAASTLKEYQEAMEDEEKLLFQCAKVYWLNEGDRNSAYFHKVVKGRRNRNRIMSITNAMGENIEGSKVAEDDEANDIVREVSDIEIKDAMFGIGDCKAPGPDEYTA
ncbi:RNA-directed DNA polymerase, eukaryota, reverse transcriptase zinc-binding domain protein [Tanacetum coccineum]